jgi:GTP cyclohydrolase I
MTAPDRTAAARAIDAFLRALGRDPDADPSLRGTGQRVADAFLDELCDGDGVDLGALLRGNVVDGRSGVVVVRDIGVTTMCPHHLLPAIGKATVAFAPEAKLVGIGALVRLVDASAHRLTLQEEIGERAVAALVQELGARWAGCRLVMTHACMVARGERRHDAKVETVAMAFASGAASPEARAEVERVLGVGA